MGWDRVELPITQRITWKVLWTRRAGRSTVGRMPAPVLHIPELAFGTPRRLPKPTELSGRVVVLDVAFAGAGDQGFWKVTMPFITGLGDRLRAWVDHHDHEEHARFANDSRFLLTCKAEHGACPELIDPALVERIGPVDTICCHNDFDGLASAANGFAMASNRILDATRMLAPSTPG